LYVGDGIKSCYSQPPEAATDEKGAEGASAAEAANKLGFFKRYRVSHERIDHPSRYFNLQTLLTDPTGGSGDPVPSVGQFDGFGNNAAFRERLEKNGAVASESVDVAGIEGASTTAEGEKCSGDTDTPIWLRYEPFILHVMCRSLKAASVLMNMARPSFKNVGLTSWNSSESHNDDEEDAMHNNLDNHTRINNKNQQCKGGGAKYLVAIWGDEGLDMPLSLPSSPRRGLFYNPENHNEEACNAKWLASLVNERHVRNWKKIERFVEAVEGLDAVEVDVDAMGSDSEDDEFEEEGTHNNANGAKAARLASGLPIPRSYDVIGDVAVLNSVPEGDEETLKQVGEWVLNRNKAIKVNLYDVHIFILCSQASTANLSHSKHLMATRYVLHAPIHSLPLIDLPENMASSNSPDRHAIPS
jgi:tRNA(Phe) wybutosine-synthesizing methylase Tyw3